VTGRRGLFVRYAAIAVGITAAVCAGSLLLDGGRRSGVLLAAAVALPVQLGAFGALLRWRHRPNGFLAAWVGGALVRLLALGGVAVAVWRQGGLDPLWTLMAVAGLLFVLHLVEPLVLRGAAPEPGTGTESG
jgi:hypothetical protein